MLRPSSLGRLGPNVWVVVWIVPGVLPVARVDALDNLVEETSGSGGFGQGSLHYLALLLLLLLLLVVSKLRPLLLRLKLLLRLLLELLP